MSEKAFSQACENNKGPILEVLSRVFANATHVLEIGSGTGQHAIHFAKHLPHLIWQPSDRAENLPSVHAWQHEAQISNCLAPVVLDVNQPQWPPGKFDAAFSANTAHIMAWEEVERMFTGVGECLQTSGCFALYGPFKFDGEFTSDSNGHFDRQLRQHAPHMGIRDFERITELAARCGLSFVEDVAMPANNRTLVFEKTH